MCMGKQLNNNCLTLYVWIRIMESDFAKHLLKIVAYNGTLNVNTYTW
jgi:hypothetical protein